MDLLDLLAEAALHVEAEAQKRRDSVSSINIKIHVGGKETLKGGKANEVSNKGATRKYAIKSDISKAEFSLKEEENKVLNIKKRSRSKRKRADFIDDKEENVHVLDQEYWVHNVPFKKEQKNSKGCGSKRHHNPIAKKALSVLITNIPTHPTALDLPQEFKNRIGEMGGNEITLIIQKCLYNSDLHHQQCRLSMPLKQIKNKGFLRQEEVQVLEKKQALQVPLIQPSLELTKVILAKWDMAKSSGVITSCYVLRSSWIKVARANQLKQNDVVQVWSFRVQDQLCMALVKV